MSKRIKKITQAFLLELENKNAPAKVVNRAIKWAIKTAHLRDDERQHITTCWLFADGSELRYTQFNGGERLKSYGRSKFWSEIIKEDYIPF